MVSILHYVYYLPNNRATTSLRKLNTNLVYSWAPNSGYRLFLVPVCILKLRVRSSAGLATDVREQRRTALIPCLIPLLNMASNRLNTEGMMLFEQPFARVSVADPAENNRLIICHCLGSLREI